MTHLTADQIVEAAEGTVARSVADHLEHCAQCRDHVALMTSVIGDVEGASGVPEPSPLFWDHLSRRVREATDQEAVPMAATWWAGLFRPLVAAAAIAGAIAIFVLVRGQYASAPVQNQSMQAVQTVASDAPADDVAADVMTAVAGDLSFDELRDANLVPSRAVVDQAVSKLNPDQQRELMRLVREEMSGSE
jgi:predicted anti-sigma-YlaC factor YlaD